MAISPASPRPVQPAERIQSIDAVRGLALLGIFVMNLPFFAVPVDFMVYRAQFPSTPANDLSLWLIDIFGQGKFMALFASLFGAGLMLYSRKFDDEAPNSKRPPLRRGAGLWYRRMAVLMVIGAIHAVFIWFGDILFPYAVAGMMLVWWVRRLPIWALGVIAAALYAIGLALMLGLTWLGQQSDESSFMMFSTADQLRAFGTEGDGTYLSILHINAVSFFSNLFFIPLMFGWMITGLMLAGMALFKTGFFSAQWSSRSYLLTIAVGLLIALPLSLFLHSGLGESKSGGSVWFFLAQPIGYPLSLAYASIVILLVKHDMLGVLTAALSNIGRLALSNYLLQSLLAAALFYRWGFGLFGRLDYPELWLVVAGVWLINIGFSGLWLSRFRIGPLEWLWRRLTYGRPPRMQDTPHTTP